MTDRGQTADVEWSGGITPVSTRFGDPYFSLSGGLDESGHVFLAGNHLPGRFRPGFHIAELGFGTGLNMLAALEAWRDSRQAGHLHYTSFEAYPMATDDIARALAAFPRARALAGPFLTQWGAGKTRFDLGAMRVEIVPGDARATLPNWQGRADAWFLDGFSPARNPELWSDDLLGNVATHTAPGGTFATYTAAGHVRRALAAAGFTVTRQPGFGRKRHMTSGVLADRAAT
jgi:tRNA U34 5-methylaminomethyl-2-thiouridine-forming methyltransferase MnmC